MHWREHDENVLNMIVPDLGTVSMKNLIMIIFMWDDAHGLMHTSLTATAIDDENETDNNSNIMLLLRCQWRLAPLEEMSMEYFHFKIALNDSAL